MSWDPKVKGLHVLNNSYYLYYRIGGRGGQQRRSKLGPCNVLSLQQARTEAKRILGLVALGGDPFGDLSSLKGVPTVRQVFEEKVANYYSQERFKRSGYYTEAPQIFENHLVKTFGHLKITAVKPPTIHQWHLRYLDRPYVGNRAKELLSGVFNWAETRGYVPPGTNPCRTIKGHREAKRTRYATIEEARRILQVIEAKKLSPISNYRKAAFLKALIFTGSRPDFLARARWKHLRYEGDSAILKLRGKSQDDEEVVLPPVVLAALEKVQVVPERLIFGSFPRKFWGEVREEAGVPDLYARDFRRFFGTQGISMGVTRDVVGELLNHRNTQTTKIYSLLEPSARLKAAKKISAEIESKLNPPQYPLQTP